MPTLVIHHQQRTGEGGMGVTNHRQAVRGLVGVPRDIDMTRERRTFGLPSPAYCRQRRTGGRGHRGGRAARFSQLPCGHVQQQLLSSRQSGFNLGLHDDVDD